MALKQLIRPVFAVVLLVACYQNAMAGSLRKIWDLDLPRASLAGSTGREQFPIFQLAFSPDGRKIAVIGDQIRKAGERGLHSLYVIPATDPQRSPVQLGTTWDRRQPEWSPDSTVIKSAGAIIRVDTGEHICEVPEVSRFVGSGLLIAGKREGGEGFGDDLAKWRTLREDRPTRFTIYGADCKPVKEWAAPGQLYIADFSSYRKVALLNTAHVGNRVIDPIDGKVIEQWDGKNSPDGLFADKGKAICGGYASDEFDIGGRPHSSEYPPKEVIRCWKVDSRQIIGESPSGHGGIPYSVAADSTRVVFSNYQYVRGVIRDRDRHVFLKAVVWDFATNQEIASWTPEIQSYDLFLLKVPNPPKHIEEPFVFAISPDGEYIAEGGNGKIRLYKIEP